jgi:hypothetical protein
VSENYGGAGSKVGQLIDEVAKLREDDPKLAIIETVLEGQLSNVNLDAINLAIQFDNVVLVPVPEGSKLSLEVTESE